MTIYDIAKKAGVSASTVSRVVNKKPGVKLATRKKVEALLSENNFSPNETARGLVNQASRMIGVLLADFRTSHHTVGAYIIERELAQQGYCCIFFNTGQSDTSKAEYIRILSQRNVDGAILIGSIFQTTEVAEAISKYLPNVPVMISNGYLDLPNVYGVLADERGGVIDCVNLLYRKKHTHPAFIIDRLTVSGQQKLDGFITAVRAHNPTTEPIIMWASEGTIADAYAKTVSLIRDHPEVDGIIYSVDLLAAGGVRALTDMNIRIPQHVAVIGIDNSTYSEITTPRLSSLDNKLAELSTTAVRNLIDALQDRSTSKKMMIFSSLVERETT